MWFRREKPYPFDFMGVFSKTGTKQKNILGRKILEVKTCPGKESGCKF